MKIPINCPKCRGILMNEEMLSIGKNIWKKQCSNKLSHKFSVFYNFNFDEVEQICIQITGTVVAVWDFKRCKLSFCKESGTIKERLTSTVYLPYFEPDLSNYDKLVSKLKTYVIFS